MHKQLQQQYGVGMIEVLITIIILSVGLLGIAATQSIAVKETGSSAQRTAAIFLINDLVERMHANPGQFQTYQEQLITYEKNIQSSGVCGAAPTQCNTQKCDNKALAKFDAWELRCKADESVRSSNIFYLAQPRRANGTSDWERQSPYNFSYVPALVIRCISGDCNNTGKVGTMEITANWQESENKRKETPNSPQHKEDYSDIGTIIIRAAM